MSTAPDTSTTGKHLPALDGIRGTAILLVFGVHLFYITSNSPNIAVRAAKLICNSGWVGVDLFFTLSGFLITGILVDTLAGSHYFRNFYARRALRIFPLYYGFFAVSFLLTLPTRFRWNASTWAYLTYTYNPFHGMPAVSTAPWMNLVHFWSLTVEEQFYFAWPLIVLLCRTRRRIVLTAATIAVASLALRVWLEVSGVSPQKPIHRVRMDTGSPGRAAAWRRARGSRSLAIPRGDCPHRSSCRGDCTLSCCRVHTRGGPAGMVG